MAHALKGITWDHPRGYAPLVAACDLYSAQTGVHVTWEKRSLKDFGDQPIDVLARDYDLLIIDHPHVGLAAASNCLVALDDCLPDTTLSTLAEQSAGPSHISYHYAGHQWALAVDAAMQTAVYRPDLIDETPQDWDSVLHLAERLRANGLYIGLPLVPTDCICSFITLCSSLGEAPGHSGSLVSEAVGREALALLRALHRVGHDGNLSWNPIGLLDHMSSAGDVVYCPITFCYTNYAREGYAAHRLTFTTLPGVRGAILGGTGVAVSAFSAHQQAACDLGAWLCSADVQRGIYVQAGGQPGNIRAWQDAEANVLTNNFFTNTLPTLEGSSIRPRHDGFITFQEQAGHIIHEWLRGDDSVDTCLAALVDLYANYQP